MRRRDVLKTGLLWLSSQPLAGAATPGRFVDFQPVLPGTVLTFPRDHGAHPQFRTEWWYVTGFVHEAGFSERDPLGFQVTFFRSRLDTDPANPSTLAARQLLFGHAAVSDPSAKRVAFAQCAAREGLGLADASEADLRVHVDKWSFERDPATGHFAIRIPGEEVGFSLDLTESEPPLLEGDQGFSRKGPAPTEASEYYSLPHLAVSGEVTVRARKRRVTGDAWMDREWSSEYLAPLAVGWDWVGINLDQGAAAMAFRIRQKSGAPLWSAGTIRHADGSEEHFGADQVVFSNRALWRSPRSGVTYPVAQELRLGSYQWLLDPIMNDQELDSSASTGTIYWEGAVRARGQPQSSTLTPSGHGYLELTGYDQPLKF